MGRSANQINFTFWGYGGALGHAGLHGWNLGRRKRECFFSHLDLRQADAVQP